MELPRLDRRTQFTNPAVGRVPGQAPPMGSAGLAQGISQAADNVAEIRGREAAKAARAELVGLEAKLNEVELALVHDPVTGARSKKGRDALGLPDQYLPQFDAKVKELGAGASNDVVRAAFGELVARRRASLAEGLSSYSAGEAERYYDTESKAQIDSFVGLASKNFDDPKAIEEYRARAEWATNDMVNRKGLGEDARKLALLETRSAVNRAVINGMLSEGRYADANKFFTEAELTPQDREALDSPVRAGNTRAAARTLADEIINRGGGITSWRDAVKDIEDPDIRAQVKQYVDEEWSDREQVRNQAERDATSLALRYVDEGKEIPPNVLAAVPGSSLAGIRAVQKAKRSGVDIVTDPATYEEVYRGLTNPDPKVRNEWLRKDLRQYWGGLDSTDREALTKLQVAQADPNSPENRKILTGIRTKDRVIDDALAKLKLPTGSSKSGKDSEKYTEAGRFRREVDDRVLGFQERVRREATVDEVQQIVDSLTRQVAVQGRVGAGEKAVFRLTPDDVPSSFSVPRRQEAERAGVPPPTPEEMLELYKIDLAGKGE